MKLLVAVLATAIVAGLVVLLTLAMDAYERAHPCPKGQHWSTQYKITACR